MLDRRLELDASADLTVASAAVCTGQALLPCVDKPEIAGVIDVSIRAIEARPVQQVKVIHFKVKAGVLSQGEFLTCFY